VRIGAALSTDPDPAKATAAAAEEALSRIGGAEVSLALVVTSRHHAASTEVASETVRIKAGPERVIGCVAETVVGGDREVRREADAVRARRGLLREVQGEADDRQREADHDGQRPARLEGRVPRVRHRHVQDPGAGEVS